VPVPEKTMRQTLRARPFTFGLKIRNDHSLEPVFIYELYLNDCGLPSVTFEEDLTLDSHVSEIIQRRS
jgi:hypothetical protein